MRREDLIELAPGGSTELDFVVDLWACRGERFRLYDLTVEYHFDPKRTWSEMDFPHTTVRRDMPLNDPDEPGVPEALEGAYPLTLKSKQPIPLLTIRGR